MITEIGIAAGEVWHLLEKEDRITLNKIASKLDSPREVILMSVGWLAREGHITLEGEAPDLKVSLRKK